jgi:SAM-dependent methyltransferase
MTDRVLFRNCPLCDCSTMVDSIQGDCSMHPLYQSSLSPKIQWKRCANCSHIFTEGYFSDETCKLIYTNVSQQVGYEFEQQRVVSSKIIEKVLPYVSQGYWLDVGFGNGSLLFTAQEYGFEPIGVDLRIANVNKMNSLGIQSYCEDLSTLSLKLECSVVSMADVLEHMPFPKKGLQAAHNLLTEGGILFASMPNMENIVWKVLDMNNANPYWGEIEHYHNFSRNRFFDLLREAGFEPIRYGISERYRACMEIIAKKINPSQ